jgi:very-short-patch-repair endonuclease
MLILSALHLRMPDGAAFSGRTAAWLHGLDLPPCDPVEVTIPDECGVSGRAGVSAYLSNFANGDVVQRRGLPTTSALRTVTDLGRRQPLVEGVVAVDMALHARLAGLADLWAFIDAHRGAKGTARLRRVLNLAEPAAASAMESRLRLQLVLAGLPRPEVQAPIHDAQGRFLGRPDLFYREQMVAIEYDGGNHRERLIADNRRQNLLLNFGILLLRFTAPDVVGNPDSVVALVRAALASRMSREMRPSRTGTGRIVRRMSA